MSRPTLVYILVLLACVTGTSVILERGSLLKAPPDLSGEWHILGDGELETSAAARLGHTMYVEQSGRFVRLSFQPRGLKVDVKLASQAPVHPSPNMRRVVQTHYKGRGWTLKTIGAGAEGPLICTLTGPETHTFTVARAAADGVDAAATLTHSPPAAPTTRPADTATADALTNAP
jgi:hypothetical protein